MFNKNEEIFSQLTLSLVSCGSMYVGSAKHIGMHFTIFSYHSYCYLI